MIEPTASDVASLLPGETIVSPSKKDNPFSEKIFLRNLYNQNCELFLKVIGQI